MPEQIYRLEDMVVEEVSLVDRAANKHKFLIIKRDSMTLKDDGKGNLVTAPDEAATPEAKTETLLELTKASQDKYLVMISNAMKALSAIGNKIKNAGTASADNEDTNKNIGAQLAAVGRTLGGAAKADEAETTEDLEVDKSEEPAELETEEVTTELVVEEPSEEPSEELKKNMQIALDKLNQIRVLMAVDKGPMDGGFGWAVSRMIDLLQDAVKVEQVIGKSEEAPIVEPVEDVSKAEAAVEDNKEDIAKSEAAVELLKSKTDELTNLITTLRKENAELKTNPAQSNAAIVEGAPVEKSKEPMRWPSDINAGLEEKHF